MNNRHKAETNILVDEITALKKDRAILANEEKLRKILYDELLQDNIDNEKDMNAKLDEAHGEIDRLKNIIESSTSEFLGTFFVDLVLLVHVS